MNPIFKKLAFWNLFAFLEREEIDEEAVDAQIESLSQDFQIRKDLFEYDHDGQHYEGENSVVIFEFDCGAEYVLQLEYTPHPEGSEKYLYLNEKKTGERHLMGWWNLEQWHPFCLRELELERLAAYWKQQPDGPWSGNDLPLLLLHDFVGFSDPDLAEDFSQKVFQTFQALAVKGFNKADQKPIAVFVYEEEQYQWLQDPTLGWVFESQIYGCYSIRNAAHASGKEGRFPFEQWKALKKNFDL